MLITSIICPFLANSTGFLLTNIFSNDNPNCSSLLNLIPSKRDISLYNLIDTRLLFILMTLPINSPMCEEVFVFNNLNGDSKLNLHFYTVI